MIGRRCPVPPGDADGVSGRGCSPSASLPRQSMPRRVLDLSALRSRTRYCSTACQAEARRQQRRCANRRHQQSPEGRKDHRDRQRDYRQRRAQKSVTDQGSASISSPGNMSTWDARSAQVAVRVDIAVASVQARKLSSKPRPPFLRCIGCGRRGRFVDPFPKIRRSKDAVPR